MIIDNPERYIVQTLPVSDRGAAMQRRILVQTLPVSDRGTEMRRRIFFIGKQRLTADQR